ncbi:MAG TPA: hypothetical protein VER17_05820 [Tepidisphaeraceae bacterium]|nr:hypothetical protein [Tepidisphaeraceae bacterium]
MNAPPEQLTSAPPPPSPQSSPEPVMPLDYGSPAERQVAAPVRDLIVGIGISLALGLGTGCLTFGLMLAFNIQEIPATFVAIGGTLLMLSLGLIGTISRA